MTPQERLDEEFGRICAWLRENRLSAHVDRQGRVILREWPPEKVAHEEMKRKRLLDKASGR